MDAFASFLVWLGFVTFAMLASSLIAAVFMAIYEAARGWQDRRAAQKRRGW